MPSVGELLQRATKDLKTANIETARLDSEILLRDVLGWSQADLIANDRELVPVEQAEIFLKRIKRRISKEPVAYILGRKAFWDFELIVQKDVLIPRPETEAIVEQGLEILADIPEPYILDLGTGSGAILIALLRARKDARGLGVDISKNALKIAEKNARAQGVKARMDLRHSDYFRSVQGRFDLIVANPPYIRTDVLTSLSPDVRNFEPKTALDGGSDGLDAYRVICRQAKQFLKTGGALILEIGFDQKQDVIHLLTKAYFSRIAGFKDLSRHDRILAAWT